MASKWKHEMVKWIKNRSAGIVRWDRKPNNGQMRLFPFQLSDTHETLGLVSPKKYVHSDRVRLNEAYKVITLRGLVSPMDGKCPKIDCC